MIYAYVICEPESAADPPCSGMGGASLRAVDCGVLAVVYSRHRSLRPKPAPATLLRHERVVEAIMARGPVLPLRFGTEVDDEARLAEVLSERADEFRHALDHVRGRVEFGLRVTPKRAARGHGAPSGRAYIATLMEERRRAEQAAQELHAPLEKLAAASRLSRRVAVPAILAASYLVDRTGIASFQARAEELAAGQHELHAALTGPWPPYNFAAVTADET